MTETQKTARRVKVVRAIRRSTELEGSPNTAATRADHYECARASAIATTLHIKIPR